MFTIEITGYGREVFAGTVAKEAYEYFQKNNIDIEDYAKEVNYTFGREEESELGIPEEYDFGAAGLHEICNLWALNSPIISEGGSIEVMDKDFNVVWSVDLADVKECGVKLVEVFNSDTVLSNLPKPSFVMKGYRPLEEMSYINEEIDAEFSLSKLIIYYGDYDGFEMITKVEYDGEELNVNIDSVFIGEEEDQEYTLFSTEDL